MITHTQTKEEEIRCKILDSARTLFGRFGLKKTSMEEIAEEAGKGKSTLYHYFKNKDEIFLAVLLMECKQFQHEIRREVDQVNGLEGKLRALLQTKLRLIKDFKVFFSFSRDMFVANFERFHAAMSGYESFEAELLGELLTEAQDKLEIPRLSKKEQQTNIYGLTISLKGLFMQAMFEEKFEEFNDNIDEIIGFLTAGLVK